MSKVAVFMMISLDGFFEGPDKEIDWHNVDDEFNEFAIEQLDSSGVLLFGRITYELMASYWPTENAIENDPLVAEKMNKLPKIVFSKTLHEVSWNNTVLVNGDVGNEIKRLKQKQGKDLLILGSSNLSASLINDGLIDEFRIIVNPVLLGAGKSVFAGITERFKLSLLKTRTFSSGNILLYYQKAG